MRVMSRWHSLLFLFALAPMGAMANPAQIDRVPLTGYSIARTETTVGQFRRFVQASGTVTRAEREGGGEVYESGWVRKPGWVWSAPFGASASPPRRPCQNRRRRCHPARRSSMDRTGAS